MNKISKIFGAFTLGLLLTGNLSAQTDWAISEEQKVAKLQIEFNEMNQSAGEELFNKNCKVCHQTPIIEDMNTRELPISPNLGAKNIQEGNTDGELYYKVEIGNIATGMPSFPQLSESDKWQIVTYLRTFYPDYQPPAQVAAAPAAEKFEGKITGMTLSLDTATHMLVAELKATDSAGNPAHAKNVKVQFFAKRSFGDLLLGKVKTDDKSMAKIEAPADLPADTLGRMTLYAQLEDGSVMAMMADVEYGQKLHYENPLDKPSFWGPRKNAPLWLKITYISVVLGVWLTIGWAAFQLFRIWMLRER